MGASRRVKHLSMPRLRETHGAHPLFFDGLLRWCAAREQAKDQLRAVGDPNLVEDTEEVVLHRVDAQS